MLVIVRLFAAFTGLLAAVVAWSLLMDGQAGTPAFGMAALLAATALGLYILLGRQLTHQHAQVLALVRRGRPLLVNACPAHAAFWLVTTAMGINLVVMAARHSQGKHLAITLLVAAVAVGALLALAHLMWQILQPGPMLRLDRHGLVHALCGRIPWSAVEGIDLRTFHIRNMPPRHILYLRLHQPRRYLERLPWLARCCTAVNWPLIGPPTTSGSHSIRWQCRRKPSSRPPGCCACRPPTTACCPIGGTP